MLFPCMATPELAGCAQTYSVGAQVLGAVEASLLCGSTLAAAAGIALWLRLRCQRRCALPCCGRRLAAGALLAALGAAAAVLACAALSQLGGAALESATLQSAALASLACEADRHALLGGSTGAGHDLPLDMQQALHGDFSCSLQANNLPASA